MGGLGASSERLPLLLIRQLNGLCDEYEASLVTKGAIDFTSFVQQVDSAARRPLMLELAATAIEHLRNQGDIRPEATILSAHPALRAELEAVLADLSDNQATAYYERRNSKPNHAVNTHRKGSRGLKIHCPHCSNPVELVGDVPSDSVDCQVCGSAINIVDRSTETRFASVLQKVDHFELISRLGFGGFGTVWKARDTELDRAVAIKIPRQGQLSDDKLSEFLREARLAAQLHHPNIVPVYEVGRDGETVFIVSDLIRGISLADFLTAKQLTFKESAKLCATIADALEHAHQKGVIHRDMKPSNIMIDHDGTPFLMDFGLAKSDADEITMTTDGQIIGTAGYMSPEQASGQSAFADRRTDIYSMGVVLFELLTGSLPFRGNRQAQQHQRLTEDAPNARTLNRQIPKDLATICSKCLERAPGARYATTRSCR